jgi:hypothetical protein
LGAVPDRERLVCLQKTILGTLTRDGLAFRRASEFSAVEADVFDQGSVMLYLIEKQRRTGDGEYARLIDRLIASLRRKARPTAHGLRFPYPTMLPNGARGPGADNWDHADPCHHAGRLLYPLALWLRQTPSDKAARRLFDAIAGYVIRDAHVFGADGSFAGHTHARTNTLLGLLIRARDTNDAATEEFVMRSVDWLVRATPRWGWVPEFMPEHGAVKPENTRAETDGLVDLISLLVMLAEKNPAYWDVVDRYVRNGLLSAQFTAAWNGSASPVGAFCGFCRPNAFGSSTMNCCSPAGAGLLADLHRLAVTKAGNEYWVNLLLDRDGPEARIKTDVHGDWFAVTITMKQAGGLVVRLPAFVSGAADVARAPSSVKFEPGLLRFGALSANADVSFSFALPHRTETFSIGGVDYRHAWRGNIVVEVRPAADRFGFFVGEASGVTR